MSKKVKITPRFFRKLKILVRMRKWIDPVLWVLLANWSLRSIFYVGPPKESIFFDHHLW